MRHEGITFLEDLFWLFADDRFAFAILAIVVFAVVLAFGFGTTSKPVASALILGAMTAITESKLRAKN